MSLQNNGDTHLLISCGIIFVGVPCLSVVLAVLVEFARKYSKKLFRYLRRVKNITGKAPINRSPPFESKQPNRTLNRALSFPQTFKIDLSNENSRYNFYFNHNLF